MCDILILPNGTEVEFVAQLRAFVGNMAMHANLPAGRHYYEGQCLCRVDVPAILRSAGYTCELDKTGAYCNVRPLCQPA